MKKSYVPDFQLRFPIADIARWANRYEFEDDGTVMACGATARDRGWYTQDEFLTITDWKTDRQKSRTRRNSASAIEDATRLALTTTDERLRIGVLTLLQGVDYPVASVFLHLAHRDPYPILDRRAIWSLGVDEQPSYYSFEFWWAYSLKCRALADEAGVEMRVLDRALGQGSPLSPRRLRSSSPCMACG